MSSVQHLRKFISERLTAAAEEIFTEFEKTIVQYEEEIDRQRRLLDITWKPQIHFHTADLPQQHDCKEEEVLADQQLFKLEMNSSLDQEEPEPPQIKEDQEEPEPPQVEEDQEEPEPPQVEEDQEEPEPPQVEEDQEEPEPPQVEENQEEPEPPQVEENQEEVHISQEGEQLVLKDETEMVEEAYEEETDHLPRLLNSTMMPQLRKHRRVGSSGGEAHLGRQKKKPSPKTCKINVQERVGYEIKMNDRYAVLKEGRQMGMPCQSFKLSCREVEESKRKQIFKYFWEKLDWVGRRVYVRTIVDVSGVKRRRTDAVKSRRSTSIRYHLVVDGRRLQVCQRMFLSTLGINQWLCLKWLGRRG